MVTDKVPPKPGPWQDLAIDMCGPFPGGDSLLVVVDYYSRWAEVKVVKSTTTTVVIRSLKAMFSTHGIPLSITSDNGPQFVSKEYRDFLEENGISSRHVTPYWPAANGEVERHNRTLLKYIRATAAAGEKWQEEMWKFLLAYRTTPHAVTGVSPAELLMQHKLKTKLPEITVGMNDTIVRERDFDLEEKGKVYGDAKRKAEEWDINEVDLVFATTKQGEQAYNPVRTGAIQSQ